MKTRRKPKETATIVFTIAKAALYCLPIVAIIVILIMQVNKDNVYQKVTPILSATGEYNKTADAEEDDVKVFKGDTYIIISPSDATHKNAHFKLTARSKINGETDYTEYRDVTDKIKLCHDYSYSIGEDGEYCYRIKYLDEDATVDRQYEVMATNDTGSDTIVVIHRHTRKERKPTSDNTPTGGASNGGGVSQPEQVTSSGGASNGGGVSQPEQVTSSGLTRKVAISACEQRVERDYSGELNLVDSAKIVGDAWVLELEYIADSDRLQTYYLVAVYCTVTGTNASPTITSYSSDINYYLDEDDGRYEYDDYYLYR